MTGSTQAAATLPVEEWDYAPIEREMTVCSRLRGRTLPCTPTASDSV